MPVPVHCKQNRSREKTPWLPVHIQVTLPSVNMEIVSKEWNVAFSRPWFPQLVEAQHLKQKFLKQLANFFWALLHAQCKPREMAMYSTNIYPFSNRIFGMAKLPFVSALFSDVDHLFLALFRWNGKSRNLFIQKYVDTELSVKFSSL